MQLGRSLLVGYAAGAGATAVILLAVWLSGATFGQRCEAKGYAAWSAEWERCVGELSGRAVREAFRKD